MNARLQSFAGEPLVLAFFDRRFAPSGADAEHAARARAALRALGASLLVASPGGLWCFRPDREADPFADTGAVREAELAALRARFGAAESGAAILVLDADMEVRFGQRVPREEASFAVLAEALDAAARAAAARPTTAAGAFTLTRRQLVLSSLVAAFSLAFVDGCHHPPAAPARAPAPTPGGDGEFDVTLDVNGKPRTVRIDARVTLLDALRERLDLPGTKKGCDMGQCGACTVLVGGRRVNACLTLAVAAQGQPIITVEGLAALAPGAPAAARADALHPLQAAFIAEDAFQCGYCTSGQLMSAAGLLAEHAQHQTVAELPDDAIREQMSGNICRCGAYPNIVAAIQRARKQL